jgi:RNA polymerase sigma-70 factor (ECF subfamily)
MAVRLALNCGEVSEARRLMENALQADAAIAGTDEWEPLRDIAAWPDAWLVAAVRRDPPDASALDALAERYWRPLFGHCYLLTLDRDKASDLAQQAWCRVLRARQRLNPGGSFPGYITTVATNLWRDSHRSARRAGPLSEERLASLDQVFSLDDGEDVVLTDMLPDVGSLQAEERRLLKLDVDRALGRLTPHLRDVLVARFITGESCAEIGLRHGRTEQTVSGWVRAAIREIKFHLEEEAQVPMRTKEP